ncbi:hypothetical protein HK105_202042 [Polyrhizophydium stewartii]|uniref:Uncharacterized protein n=1 Tax=Polyrhizophydium stewartii TaxID=2732419 RepID=A0ABR4NGL9_9FUNG
MLAADNSFRFAASAMAVALLATTVYAMPTCSNGNPFLTGHIDVQGKMQYLGRFNIATFLSQNWGMFTDLGGGGSQSPFLVDQPGQHLGEMGPCLGLRR